MRAHGAMASEALPHNLRARTRVCLEIIVLQNDAVGTKTASRDKLKRDECVQSIGCNELTAFASCICCWFPAGKVQLAYARNMEGLRITVCIELLRWYAACSR